MNRRGFLGALFGSAGALVVDPERALWTPGAKLISIPRRTAAGWASTALIKPGDVFTIAGDGREYVVVQEVTSSQFITRIDLIERVPLHRPEWCARVVG
jgi:hypothetical protein